MPCAVLHDSDCCCSPFQSVGWCADFTSLVPEGDYVCMITHLEAPDPGATYLSTLVQGDDGHLTVTKTEPMDWSEYDGIWVRPALCCHSWLVV